MDSNVLVIDALPSKSWRESNTKMSYKQKRKHTNDLRLHHLKPHCPIFMFSLSLQSLKWPFAHPPPQEFSVSTPVQHR
mgnify:CR=1 FL=1